MLPINLLIVSLKVQKLSRFCSYLNFHHLKHIRIFIKCTCGCSMLQKYVRSQFTILVRKMNCVFVYGTLKQGQPNHYLLENESNGQKVFCGHAKTVKKYPMVIGSRYNIPYILDCADTGHHIMGEIYK